MVSIAPFYQHQSSPSNFPNAAYRIIASANLAGCDRVFSEDLNAGQTYGKVTVINPFAAG